VVAAWAAAAAFTAISGAVSAAVGGGAVGSAVGAGVGVIGAGITSQAITQAGAIAMGQQNGFHFKWKDVARDGLMAAASVGVEKWAGNSAKAVASAKKTGEAISTMQKVGSAVNASKGYMAAAKATARQLVSSAMDREHKFSWKSIAASAIGAELGGAVSSSIGSKVGADNWGTFAATLTESVVSSAVETKIFGNKFNFKNVARQAVGQAIGASLTSTFDSWADPQDKQAPQKASAQQHAHSTQSKSSGAVVNERGQGSLEQSDKLRRMERFYTQQLLDQEAEELGLDFVSTPESTETVVSGEWQTSGEGWRTYPVPPEADVFMEIFDYESANAQFYQLGGGQDLSSFNYDIENEPSNFDKGLAITGQVAEAAFYGTVNAVWQPVAQTVDLLELAFVALPYNLFSDDVYTLTGFSNVAKANSFSEGFRAAFEYNLVGGVGIASYDMTTSFSNGDYVGGALGGVSVLSGFLGIKGVKLSHQAFGGLKSTLSSTFSQRNSRSNSLDPATELAEFLAQGGRLVPCFAEGTLVHTDRGLISIESFKGGERVLARSERSGQVTYKTVINTKVTPQQETYSVVISDQEGSQETYQATEGHPFWVQTVGWRKAASLQPGDKLQDAEGDTLTVVSVTKDEGLRSVYNIEVLGYHTYHIGKLGVWVHNDDCFELSLRNGHMDVHDFLDAQDGLGALNHLELDVPTPTGWRAADDAVLNNTTSLSVRPAASGVSPANFNSFSLASRQDTLDLWNQALKSKAFSSHPKGNAYQDFLRQLESGVEIYNIDKGLLEDAFGAVSAKYTSLLRAKHRQGLMLDVGDGPVHHWNYNKILYPQDLVDPRNLIMTRNRSHHMEIHRATTSGHITKSPASPEHIREIDSYANPIIAIPD
ncbi:hypothetical protein KCM76_10060, partial [Zooshikella marina]